MRDTEKQNKQKNKKTERKRGYPHTRWKYEQAGSLAVSQANAKHWFTTFFLEPLP